MIEYDPSKVQLVALDNGVSMLVHVEFETARYLRSAPLLEKYGAMVTCKNPYPINMYPPASPYDRCFDKAFEYANEYGLSYVEGFLVSASAGRLIYLGHAWLEDEIGRIVDPTCYWMQNRSGMIYYGIKFNPQYLRKWKDFTGYHGVLDGHRDGLKVGVYYDDPSVFLAR